MAHKIIGVDLGGSSLKLAHYDARFRNATLLDVHVLPSEPPTHVAMQQAVPATDVAVQQEGAAAPPKPREISATQRAADRLTAQLRHLKRAMAEGKLLADEVFLALPGEHVTFRVVDLPFSDERRIESVLGYELESQVLVPVEELVIDFAVVGARGSDTRVLVAAAPRELIRALVETATAEALAVRVIAPSPLAYAALLADETRARPGATLVLDVGYDTTTTVVLREATAEMARSIARAGRHFTDAIAAAFRLDQPAAERAKLDAGFIGHAAMHAETPSQKRMDECLREAARPLVREIRQTLAAYRAAYSVGVDRVWLTGGGAKLVGLREHIAEELGLPVEPLPQEALAGEPGKEPPAEADVLGVAMGMAQIGLGVGSRVNLRKGEFSYKSDFSFLRGKALHVGIALLAVVFFAVVNAAAALRGLRHEHDALETRLEKQTQDLFGHPRTDAAAISDELKLGTKAGGPTIPTITAYDVLDMISRKVPASDKMKLDILELDIKPKKVFLKATVENGQQVDDLADALSKIECFGDATKGKSSTVTAPAAAPPPSSGSSSSDGKDQPPARTELKQFTLTFNTTCP